MECPSCGSDVETLYKVKVKGKAKKLCEDCADRAREEGEIADGALDAMRDMMGYKNNF